MARIIEHQNQFLISQGESVILIVSVKDSKSKKPANVEDCTVYFSLKENINDNYNLIHKISTEVTEIALTKPRDGIFEIYLGSSDTVNLQEGFYIFDVWLLFPSGARKPIIRQGQMEVLRSVTRFNISV